MCFQDVVFLPFQTSFYTTFVINCGRGEGFRKATCLNTVAGGKQGHAPCKMLLLQQILFLCHSNFIEITRLSQK